MEWVLSFVEGFAIGVIVCATVYGIMYVVIQHYEKKNKGE